MRLLLREIAATGSVNRVFFRTEVPYDITIRMLHIGGILLDQFMHRSFQLPE